MDDSFPHRCRQDLPPHPSAFHILCILSPPLTTSGAELHTSVQIKMTVAAIFKDNMLQHLAMVRMWASLSHYCQVFSRGHACWWSPRQDRDSLGPSLAPQMDSSNFRENTCYLATFGADGADYNSPSPCAGRGQEPGTGDRQAWSPETCSMQTLARGLPVTSLGQLTTITHLGQVPQESLPTKLLWVSDLAGRTWDKPESIES